MHLKVDQIDYVLLDDGSEREVATIRITVPGATIMIMGEVEDVDGGLVVGGACAYLDLVAGCGRPDAGQHAHDGEKDSGGYGLCRNRHSRSASHDRGASGPYPA